MVALPLSLHLKQWCMEAKTQAFLTLALTEVCGPVHDPTSLSPVLWTGT
jgi:hypothetical protein